MSGDSRQPQAPNLCRFAFSACHAPDPTLNDGGGTWSFSGAERAHISVSLRYSPWCQRLHHKKEQGRLQEDPSWCQRLHHKKGQRRRAEALRVVREKDRSAKLQKLFVGRLRAEALRVSDRGREQSVRASCANDCVSDHCRIVRPRSFVVLQHRLHFLIAQMAMIGSVAVLRQRVEELQKGLQAKLEGQGLNTFRSLAHRPH